MGADGHAGGFDLVVGHGWGQNKTKIELTLENSRKYTATVKVRNDGVVAILDGKE